MPNTHILIYYGSFCHSIYKEIVILLAVEWGFFGGGGWHMEASMFNLIIKLH